MDTFAPTDRDIERQRALLIQTNDFERGRHQPRINSDQTHEQYGNTPADVAVDNGINRRPAKKGNERCQQALGNQNDYDEDQEQKRPAP